MTEIVSSIIRVKKPDGTVVAMTADRVSVGKDALVLRHPFAVGDVDQVGIYSLRPLHSGAFGTIRGAIVQFKVNQSDDF